MAAKSDLRASREFNGLQCSQARTANELVREKKRAARNIAPQLPLGTKDDNFRAPSGDSAKRPDGLDRARYEMFQWSASYQRARTSDSDEYQHAGNGAALADQRTSGTRITQATANTRPREEAVSRQVRRGITKHLKTQSRMTIVQKAFRFRTLLG